uniref:Uncharacterized protein n=1 Tax=Acrobeloides nanus TaxID=290746 RepID=A0A914CE17_9BILA
MHDDSTNTNLHSNGTHSSSSASSSTVIDNIPFAEEIVQANKEDAQDDEVGKKPDDIPVDQAMHIDKKVDPMRVKKATEILIKALENRLEAEVKMKEALEEISGLLEVTKYAHLINAVGEQLKIDPVEIETNRDKMWQKVLDLAKQLKENMDEYEKHQADLEELYREYREATEANKRELEELEWRLKMLEDLNKY